MAASIAFQSAAITSGSATSRTLSFTVATAAGQERLVALSAIANASPATVTFTSVAIDGQSATLVGSYARSTDGLGNGAVVAFFRANGTANTSINVTCNISTGAVFDCRGAVWNLSNAGSLLASIGDTAAGVNNIGNIDLNANTVVDGAAAAYVLAYACSTRNITWSGLTERLDGSTPLYSGDWHSAADLIVGSTSTPLTITATLPTTFDSNSAVAGVAVSFSPVASGTTLTADAGSYALTGSAALLARGQAVAAGAYALTGTAAALALREAASAGSYALTGTAATLVQGQTAAAGAYALTGSAVTFVTVGGNITLTADAGSYTLTGAAATFPGADIVPLGGGGGGGRKRRLDRFVYDRPYLSEYAEALRAKVRKGEPVEAAQIAEKIVAVASDVPETPQIINVLETAGKLQQSAELSSRVQRDLARTLVLRARLAEREREDEEDAEMLLLM